MSLRAVVSRWCVLAALCACGPVTGGAGGGGASTGSSARIDHSADRVHVTTFTHITGVAVTHRHAYVSSEHGVAAFDRLLQSWVPPAGEPETGPARRVLGVVAHPLDDGAWVIEVGAVRYIQPALGWSMRTTVVGTIDRVLFDRRDPRAGIWVRALGRWTHVTGTGMATPAGGAQLPPPEARLSPTTLEELARRRPGLRDLARLLTRDAAMRSWPASAGDEAPDGSDVWLGTWGYGVFRVEPEWMRAVHEPYGLLERGAGALATGTDGVWIAGLGDPRASTSGLVWTSSDLREWLWQTSAAASGLEGARAHALVVRGRRAWVGTDRGAVRLELDGPAATTALRSAHGLPSDRVLALLPRLDGLWIGTTRGLAFVRERWESSPSPGPPEIDGATVLAGTAVHDLVSVGDTIWIASDAGVVVLLPGPERRLVRPAGSGGDQRLARAVRAIAASDSLIAAALDDEVLLIDARSGRPMNVPALQRARSVGTPVSLAMDARTVWIAGASGVLVIDRETGASRLLSVPGDLPGRVHDLALAALVAWVATEEGLVRLRRDASGMPR